MVSTKKRKKSKNGIKNLNGEARCCSPCNSIKHMVPLCTHSWENMTDSGEGERSKEESSFTTGEVGISIREQQVEGEEGNDIGMEEVIYGAA